MIPSSICRSFSNLQISPPAPCLAFSQNKFLITRSRRISRHSLTSSLDHRSTTGGTSSQCSPLSKANTVSTPPSHPSTALQGGATRWTQSLRDDQAAVCSLSSWKGRKKRRRHRQRQGAGSPNSFWMTPSTHPSRREMQVARLATLFPRPALSSHG